VWPPPPSHKRLALSKFLEVAILLLAPQRPTSPLPAPLAAFQGLTSPLVETVSAAHRRALLQLPLLQAELTPLHIMQISAFRAYQASVRTLPE
jgi:hypothetical protein